MRIGELADEVGVNPKTVRYYESIGLLPEPARRPSGYREYDDGYIDRRILALQDMRRQLVELTAQADALPPVPRGGTCKLIENVRQKPDPPRPERR